MNDVILVHSMGKVGSSSILRVARDLDGWEALHTHQLNRKTLDHFIKDVDGTTGHARDSLHFLASEDRYSRIRIITGVRDPVARNVSAFFENLRSYGFNPPLDKVAVADVISTFQRRYRHGYPADWFDLQVREPLGIDVFEHELDFESGGHIIRHGRNEMLLLRAEDGNARKSARIAEFLEVGAFQLGVENAGDDKLYSTAYSTFKSTFKPTRDFLDEMYESRFARHFYSPEELLGFLRRWSK